MDLEEARAIGLKLFDAGLTPWLSQVPAGYSVCFVVEGVRYELK